MKRRLLMAALIAAALSSAAAQTKINASVADVSSQFTSINRGAVHTVDGSGLNNSNNPPTHGTDPTTMWLNWGDGTDSGTPDPDYPTQLGHITFDLGANAMFQSFRVWNYNEVNAGNGQSFTNRGVQTLTISIATMAGGPFVPLTDPATNTTTWTFAQAPGNSSYTGQLFTLALPVSTEFVRFDIKSNYGDPHRYIGLSEVQFFTPAPVPEPSTYAILGLGAALLGAVRRFRTKR